MLAIHHCAPPGAKPFTQVALGWMIAAAGFTTVVHFVELTVARHIDPSKFPGYARIFGYEWPSTFYAIDIVAWDMFFGLALLFAVPAFAHRGDTALVRRGLITSGSFVPDRADRAIRQRPRMAHHRHPRLHRRLRRLYACLELGHSPRSGPAR